MNYVFCVAVCSSSPLSAVHSDRPTSSGRRKMEGKKHCWGKALSGGFGASNPSSFSDHLHKERLPSDKPFSIQFDVTWKVTHPMHQLNGQSTLGHCLILKVTIKKPITKLNVDFPHTMKPGYPACKRHLNVRGVVTHTKANWGRSFTT